MGILKNIEWTDTGSDLIIWKYPISKDHVNKGSALTVRESQVAIFVDKGRLADVFLPGFYKLDTDNMPILTKMMSWKYGFETPFKSDIYFVSTKQFTNQKWGTVNPILVRDKDYGAVRIRGFGNYSFKVSDAYIFMQNLTGTLARFETSQISDYLRSMVLSGISDAIGEIKIPILDIPAKYIELSEIIKEKMQGTFTKIGMKLVNLVIENVSLPEEVEKAIDQRSSLGALGGKLNEFTQYQTAQAIRDAANNPNGGGIAEMGVGFGAGMAMGNAMMNAMNPQQNAQQQAVSATADTAGVCLNCKQPLTPGAKFCANCGTPVQTKKFCPNCGTQVDSSAKFCTNCGKAL